ncbi:hypothetical protein KKB44_02015 [Candidatus Micrarchaeota archaeon]|nr:hypothetical protein [Candidatus Micrarchaeota archaeon]
MGYNIVADFFNMIDISLFDNATILLIICFVIWELPRSLGILSKEYTEGLYPENGRVIDFTLFVIGIATIFFVLLTNATNIVLFLKTPGITAFFLILMVVIPLIIALGFLKRIFQRIEAHDSITIFLTHAFLDLMHTIFHIVLVILVIPSLGYLVVGG